MIPLGLLLLLAASSRIDLVDEAYEIPPVDWRYVEVELKQLPVIVRANFASKSGSKQVRLALMRIDDLKLLRRHQPYGAEAVTAAGERGRIEKTVSVPGEYAVVVDNRDPSLPAGVHLNVSLDFSVRSGPAITYVPPERRLAVILISFAVFFGIVTWSAKRLLGAVR